MFNINIIYKLFNRLTYKTVLNFSFAFTFILLSCNLDSAKNMQRNDFKAKECKYIKNISNANSHFYHNPLKTLSCCLLLFFGKTVESTSYIVENNHTDIGFYGGNKILQKNDDLFIGGYIDIGSNLDGALYRTKNGIINKANIISEIGETYIQDMLFVDEEEEGSSLLILSNTNNDDNICSKEGNKALFSNFNLGKEKFLWSVILESSENFYGKTLLRNKIFSDEILIGGYTNDKDVKNILIYTYNITNNAGIISEKTYAIGNSLNNTLNSMIYGNDDALIFVGSTELSSNKKDSLVGVIENDLDELKTYSHVAPGNIEINSITNTNDGNSIVCGYWDNPISQKREMVFYYIDSSGQYSSINTIETIGNSSCNVILINDEGKIYLGGSSINKIGNLSQPTIFEINAERNTILNSLFINKFGQGQINSMDSSNSRKILFTGFSNKIYNGSNLLYGEVFLQNDLMDCDVIPINAILKNVTDFFNNTEIFMDKNKGPLVFETEHIIKASPPYLINSKNSSKCISKLTLNPTFEPTLEPTLDPTLDPTIYNDKNSNFNNNYKSSDYFYYGIILGSGLACGLILLIYCYKQCRNKYIYPKQSNKNSGDILDEYDNGKVYGAQMDGIDKNKENSDMESSENSLSNIENNKVIEIEEGKDKLNELIDKNDENEFKDIDNVDLNDKNMNVESSIFENDDDITLPLPPTKESDKNDENITLFVTHNNDNSI